MMENHEHVDDKNLAHISISLKMYDKPHRELIITTSTITQKDIETINLHIHLLCSHL